MTHRTFAKPKSVQSTLENKDVLDLFHGVLGTADGGVHISVAHPKYETIRRHTERFVLLLEALRDSHVLQPHPEERARLVAYARHQRGQYAESFAAPDLAPFLAATAALTPDNAYAKVPKPLEAKFLEVFTAAKKCSVVNTAIVTCKNLIPYKSSIKDIAKLKGKFMTKSGGLTISPVEGLALNFKQIYGGATAPDRTFILTVLHKMWAITHDVYEAVSSPDIDVGEFSTVIMSAIGDVRKHIPRCDGAFDKIVESVDLLKGNFGGYYRDYVASSNPTIIMENFVLDVAKNSPASPQLTQQFRKIIKHYRNLASQHATHPKLQTLFSHVDKNFQELERQNRKTDAEPTADADDDSDDEEGGEEIDTRRPSAAALPALHAAAAAVAGGESATGAGASTGASTGPGAVVAHAAMSKSKKKRLKRQAASMRAAAAASALVTTATPAPVGAAPLPAATDNGAVATVAVAAVACNADAPSESAGGEEDSDVRSQTDSEDEENELYDSEYGSDEYDGADDADDADGADAAVIDLSRSTVIAAPIPLGPSWESPTGQSKNEVP